MVERIGSGGGALGREAIRAAIDAQRKAAERIRSGLLEGAAPADAGRPAAPAGFGAELRHGLEEINAKINAAESLPRDFVAGKIEDFHEIALHLKQADVGFRFALEIRNKLIDAYREVMRMNV